MPIEQVDWDDIHFPSFMMWSTVGLTATRSLVYPLMVCKTKQQNLSSGGLLRRVSMRDTIRTTYRAAGFRGFYQGFWTTFVGVLPAQTLYITALESSRAAMLRLLDGDSTENHWTTNLADVVSGGTASLCSSFVTVPVDIISQRMMVQNAQAKEQYHYRNGFHAIREIVRGPQGVRGLYRGYVISMLSYIPTSALWWGTYRQTRRWLVHLEYTREESASGHGSVSSLISSSVSSPSAVPSSTSFLSMRDRNSNRSDHRNHSDGSGDFLDTDAPTPADTWIRSKLLDLAAGLCAGSLSATLTMPLDVIKTNLQLKRSNESSTKEVVNIIRTLWGREGWRGFLRGVIPRVLTNAPSSALMIGSYEYVKQLSAKTPTHLQ